MNPEKIEKLIIRYLSNSISQKEWNELNEWFEKNQDITMFKEYQEINYAIDYAMLEFDTKKTKASVLKKIRKEKRLTSTLKIMKYAAVLVVLIVSSYFITKTQENNTTINTPVIVDTNIEPGTNKATLTLGDGSVVDLEKGISLQTKNAESNGSEIVYKKKKQRSEKLVYNYLTIPRGGQYFVKLSDGTKVWLNSESQLKYPVNFIKGQDRKVELVYGEAYFDVSPSREHNGAQFKVYNNKQEISVLGTEFNVKAYKDESNIYTTLVEGKVAVNYEGMNRNLKPNQQSNIDKESGFLLVKTVDVYNEVSWKEGVFSFEEKTLKEIMTILSRWYDMEVIFKNKSIEDYEFVGVIGKDDNIEDILNDIKNFGIIKNYEINEKKVVLE